MKIDAKSLARDIDQSLGLPARYYFDPDIYQFELEAIWRKEWQYFAPLEKLRNPGDVEVGRAGDIPVVVTRTRNGELRGFVNVCSHRGYRVQEAGGSNCRHLVCRYHAWTYDLDGRLIGAPGSEDDPSFDKSELGLLPIAVEELGAGIYVNADPAAPTRRDSLPGCLEAYEEVGIDLNPDRYTLARSTRHDVPSNWKMWFDNFCECYHCDNIHSGSFSAAYDSSIDSVYTSFRDRYMVNRFKPKNSPSGTDLRANNYRSSVNFPGGLILQQDDLMILSQMRPLGPERTEQQVDYFAEEGADSARVEAWVALWEQTFSEDGAATAIQQEGFRTGAIERSRLMRPREEAVFFFNKTTCQAYERHLAQPTAAE